MHRTIALRLTPTPDHALAFRQTMAVSVMCFDAVTKLGWMDRCRNGVELHRRSYYALRGQFPNMPSQLVVSARMKATEALGSAIDREKKGKKTCRPTMHRAMIRYDARSMTVNIKDGHVSLATVVGRQRIGFAHHWQADHWLSKAEGVDSADLVERDGGFWLKLVLTIPTPAVELTGHVTGADLGINRPVVTSDGAFLGRRHWKDIEARCFRLKRSLQAKGTKSAKRHLKVLRRRQQRFRLDCDRVLAKRLVQPLAAGDTLAIENLTSIRERTQQRGRQQRRRHHSWSYAQLRGCIENKAEAKGVVVDAVDPRKTSQRCSRCGHVHKRSRLSQSRFVCVACGFEINADLNAARNIAWKHLQACVPSGDTGRPPTPRVKASGVNRPKATAAEAVAADVAMKFRAQHDLDSVTNSSPSGLSS